MTTTARRAHAPAWALAFLAAVLAVVLGTFTAAPASAATTPTAQNAVGASTPTAQVTVEPPANITAGQRLGNDPPQAGIVVATGVAAEAGAATRPVAGQPIYRVYGGDSAAGGASWSPVNPGSVANYRSAAGLPSGGASGATNTGQFVIEGTLNDPAAVVLQRSALPLDGTEGGLPEYIIPNWMENGSITITRVSGANPEF
jgi:hypothetical protein